MIYSTFFAKLYASEKGQCLWLQMPEFSLKNVRQLIAEYRIWQR